MHFDVYELKICYHQAMVNGEEIAELNLVVSDKLIKLGHHSAHWCFNHDRENEKDFDIDDGDV